jgi:hypothetical protein
MRVTDFCKSYFNGFQDISNYKRNNVKTNILGAVKILSYFTVAIPLGFAAVFGAAYLYNRISKKEDLSFQDKNVNDQAKKVLLKKATFISKNAPSTLEFSNCQLAGEIIAARGGGDKYVKTICSADFLVDPIAHLVHEMIQRELGGARMDDPARAFVIGQIPNFIEKVSSLDYLRSFAERYFENDPNKGEIIQVFERSLSNAEFQRDLKFAVKEFNDVQEQDSFCYAENVLRIPLTIYGQSANLKEYSSPKNQLAE